MQLINKSTSSVLGGHLEEKKRETKGGGSLLHFLFLICLQNDAKMQRRPHTGGQDQQIDSY